MTRQDIARDVSLATGLPMEQARSALGAVLQSITQGLASGKRVELRGFGVFAPRPRQARTARNPRTGARVPVGADVRIRFTAGAHLLKAVQPTAEVSP